MKPFLILIPVAYFTGSINFSILLFKILGKEDPRAKYSGNPGVTNVYRQAGIFWASLVFVFDFGRAVGISALAVYMLPMIYVPWIGFSLILGNRFPCFHAFKGGKGVANFLGFTIIISPVSAVLSALIWVLLYWIVRIPFIASFFMILIITVGTIITCVHNPVPITGTIATAFFIIYNHKKNIIEFISKKNLNYNKSDE